MATSYRKSLDQIRRMHETMRPHGTRSERKWAQHWCGQLPGAYVDTFGNWHVHVDDSPILWSSHTDTVHNRPGTQHVTFDHTTGELALPKVTRSNCLGADCTAGVWLMRELVKRKVPGHYIFHYGEERGGIGSTKLALNYSAWLKTFKCAIALDRKGYSDVITHQSYGRTASDAFAKSLASKLGGLYKPCSTGLYTDTAEYADDIAECTNVSVGYFGAHSSAESLDCYHLLGLIENLATVRVDDLTIARTPGDWDLQSRVSYWHGWRDYTGWDTWPDTDCDSAARKYAESGVAIYSSGTAGDKSSNTHAQWECCYCFEVNEGEETHCDWCTKPRCDECESLARYWDTPRGRKDADRDRAMYLDPDMYAVHKALNTQDATPKLLTGITVTVKCDCTPTKDSRGVITHSLDCAISQAIVR